MGLRREGWWGRAGQRSQGLGGRGRVDSAEEAAGGEPVGRMLQGAGSVDTETDGERKMETFSCCWGRRRCVSPV